MAPHYGEPDRTAVKEPSKDGWAYTVQKGEQDGDQDKDIVKQAAPVQVAALWGPGEGRNPQMECCGTPIP